MRLSIVLTLILSTCAGSSPETATEPAPSEVATVEPATVEDSEPTDDEAVPEMQRRAPTDEASAAFAASTLRFGVSFWGRVRARPGNLVLSPGSMSIAFAMTYAGARGETAEALTPEQIEGWIAALRVREVEVSLPRFRIEMQEPLALKPMLTAMGMSLPFQPAADFSAMSNPANPDEHLYIADAYHRAFIEVTESGTEAAAASAVIRVVRGAEPQPPVPPRFTADHPFLFLLRDVRTGSVLFMGRVSRPRA